MVRDDDGSRWRGWVALAILASLVGMHLWVRSLNRPQEPVTPANRAPAANLPTVDPEIDPSLPPQERDRLARERALRKLLDQQTQDLRKQAALALAAGQYEEAAALYRKVLKIDAENAEAKDGLFKATDERAFLEHFTRGQEALALGDLETALYELEKASALKPKDPDVVGKAVDTRLAILNRDARRAEAAERWEDAVALYQQALALRDDAQLAEYVKGLEDTVVKEAFKKATARFFERLREADQMISEGKVEPAVAIYEDLKKDAERFSVDPAKIERKLVKAREHLQGYANLYNDFLKKAEAELVAERFAEAIALASKAQAQSYRDPQDRAGQLIRDAERRAVEKDMVRIPGGAAIVGGGPGAYGVPERRVTLQPFYIDRCEVTNRQYAAFVQATNREAPSFWNGKAPPRGMEDIPVVAVSWEDATAFARWVKKRLPTEEEWEMAARGTDGRAFPWGNTFERTRANTCLLGVALPMPVGVFGDEATTRQRLEDWFKSVKAPVPKAGFLSGASPYGCQDMAGNAMEWTATEVAPPDGARAKVFRILKGGSFLFNDLMCHAGARLPENPTLRLMGVGFRCAKDAE